VNRRGFATLLLAALCPGATAPAQERKPIVLPKPDTEGGAPLMKALAERKTTRVFSDQPLPAQTLSNLLWAAFGQNRPKADRPGIGRTAPSAMNRQEIDLYVALPDGVYVYEAEPHRLRPVVAGDQRARLGPEAAARAAVTIVYVADAQAASAQVDTGFIGQNVYLFAAANGLNAWFRSLNADAVAAALKLEPPKRPLYAQTVGFPPK
jgi:nitroreductase